ncbi:condensation domain-containing protein [Nocardia beijingensis]
MTPGQADVLLHHVDDPHLSVPISYRYLLRGTLDEAALVRSLRYAIETNGALAARFRSDGETFVQSVSHDSQSNGISLLDVGETALETLIRYCDSLLHADAASWDLWNTPPVHFRLIRAGAGTHMLLLTFQHAVINARGVAQVEKDLFTAYRGLVDSGNLPATTRAEYREAVESSYSTAASAAADLEFWKQAVDRESDSISNTETPETDRRRNLHRITVDRSTFRSAPTRGIHDVAQLLASFAGFVADGRRQDRASHVSVDVHFEHLSSRYRDVVGMFSVIRPVTIDLSPNGRPTPEATLDALFATMQHKAVDSVVLRNMERDRGIAHARFPDFNYLRHRPAQHTVQLGDCLAERTWYVPRRTGGRPASMQVYDRGRTLTIVLGTDSSIFPERIVENYLESLRQML